LSKLSRRLTTGQTYFGWLVVLPTLLAALYYGLFASDIYVSESRFVIKSQSQRTAQVASIANLIQTAGLSSGQEQANEVLDFIRSRDAMNQLEPHLNLGAMFSAAHADWFSQFPKPLHASSRENLYLYFKDMVNARQDIDSGTAVLTTKAFTPEDARKLNERLLGLSENLVNKLNQRAEHRAIAEGEARVAVAQQRVAQARLALRQYRNEAELLDPAKQATGVLDISNKLVAEEATLRAQLDLMERVTPANPTIPALRSRIAALQGQAGAQNGRVVGNSGAISSKLGEYEKRAQEQEFAAQNLTAASIALEQARAEAVRQQFYLERVVEPGLPDMPLLPRRLYAILTIAATLTCLYFIGWMLVVGILEHAPED
jgi:capsular polysaccharide transport system permease protein